MSTARAAAGAETGRDRGRPRSIDPSPLFEPRTYLDVDGAPSADRMLRFMPPVVYFRRTASRDAELGGRSVRTGDKAVVFHPVLRDVPAGREAASL